MATTSYGTVRAPEFPPDLPWLNTPQPLRLAHLRGKFVLLDFWTYCCINCMHVLPDLRRLEHRYPDELVVIGVHSAKFYNERELENIRNAVLRYEVEHPVVNDRDFKVWSQYAVQAWPTFYLIDPKGYIVGRLSGEGVYEPVDRLLQELVPRFEAEGALDRTPRAAFLEREREPDRMLLFPGKVTADARTGRLFISDSNHHRILVTDLEGLVQFQIGSGTAGLGDGPLAEAAFRGPQGTCYDPVADVLYVADTENHALRRVRLAEGRVETLAGDGTQAPWGTGAAGPGAPLNSPWDVLLHEGRLYVAMAGAHQLWTFDPATGVGEAYAGNGREHLVDAPRRDAQLAQPSGLATDGTALFFVDSETSALRRVPFGDAAVSVQTLLGEGLFEFGDIDGRRPAARLQHPLGLAFADGRLWIADTYNHKIKLYDPGAQAVVTFAGTGAPGREDGGRGQARFNEPGGLAAAGGRLFVADTNNHQVRVVDLATGHVRTLPIAERLEDSPRPDPDSYDLQTVGAGTGEVQISISLPEGYEPNAEHPGTLRISTGDPEVARPEADALPAAYPTSFPFTFGEGETELQVEGTLYYCEERSGRCLMEAVRLRVPLAVRAGGDGRTAAVRVPLQPLVNQ